MLHSTPNHCYARPLIQQFTILHLRYLWTTINIYIYMIYDIYIVYCNSYAGHRNVGSLNPKPNSYAVYRNVGALMHSYPDHLFHVELNAGATRSDLALILTTCFTGSTSRSRHCRWRSSPSSLWASRSCSLPFPSSRGFLCIWLAASSSAMRRRKSGPSGLRSS